MIKVYAVMFNGKQNNTPVCFPKLEWAQSYRDYMTKRLGLLTRGLFALTSKPAYTIKVLNYCERPPKMAETGNDTHQ